MKTLLFVIVLLVLAWVYFTKIAKKGAARDAQEKGSSAEQPRRKQLLSEREQAMHNRLSHALPELVVLAQVSFSALLTARAYAARNTFDRKIADFVVCDKAFQVLAVIELDDASHKGKTDKDAARDAMLVSAGYRVLRYPNIPDLDRVRSDFLPTTPPAQAQRQAPVPS
jgi:very-short-patch-repair endonuclease